MTQVRSLLERIQPQAGWLDIFTLLLPLLEDLFKGLMENCADTEDEAVDLVCSPGDWRFTIAEGRLVRKMRKDRQITLRGRARRICARQALSAAIDEANNDPETVAAAFTEVRGAA